MKIVLDAFGCDFPDKVIKGASKAVREIEDLNLIVVGDEKYINSILNEEQFDRNRIEILHASEVITNNESPSEALRHKKNSSLRVAYERLKTDDDCVAMVSCGSTGAVIVGAVLCLGRAEGIERPALACILPCDNKKLTCLVDCGANVDTKPHQLLQFATLANDYVKKAYSIKEPKIALLSVGTEDAKGNLLTKETFSLLKQSNLNFIGNIEGKTILSGDADVIVTDGFSGNVLLKSIEGVSASVIKAFAKLLVECAPKNSDLTFINRALFEFNRAYDLNSLGGGILLGVKKTVIKGHGSANEDTVVNTIKQALKVCQNEKPIDWF